MKFLATAVIALLIVGNAGATLAACSDMHRASDRQSAEADEKVILEEKTS